MLFYDPDQPACACMFRGQGSIGMIEPHHPNQPASRIIPVLVLKFVAFWATELYQCMDIISEVTSYGIRWSSQSCCNINFLIAATLYFAPALPELAPHAKFQSFSDIFTGLATFLRDQLHFYGISYIFTGLATF